MPVNITNITLWRKEVENQPGILAATLEPFAKSGADLVPPMMLAAVASLLADPQPKSQPKSGATASGVFVGRSGKPMAKARLIVGEVVGDEELIYAKIKLPSNLPAALSDDKGQFQFTGFPPGRYTIVYQLAGTTTIPPAEINIKALSAVTRSILPFMVNVEIGTSGEPFAQRLWGRTFTLLKGTHLLFAGREHEDLERHRAAQHADAMYNRRLFGRSRRWNVSEGARTTIYECQHEWLGMDEVRNTGVSDGEPTNSIYVAAMNQGSEMED